MLLENIRFDKGETKNDPELSKKLASLADVYVNDAFGTAHRAHASTAGVAAYLPAVCGYLVQKEVSIMGKAPWPIRSVPSSRFSAVRRSPTSSDVINNLLEKVDTLIIGGGMAYTFVAAKGYGIGKACLTRRRVDYCKDMMKKAEEKGVKLPAPDRHRRRELSFPTPIDAPIEVETVHVTDRFPADMDGSGHRPRRPATLFARRGQERQAPSSGTAPWACSRTRRLPRARIAVAQALADSATLSTIVGGGDSAAAVRAAGLCRQDHPHLHRRRRLAGIPRGSGAARHRLPTG